MEYFAGIQAERCQAATDVGLYGRILALVGELGFRRRFTFGRRRCRRCHCKRRLDGRQQSVLDRDARGIHRPDVLLFRPSQAKRWCDSMAGACLSATAIRQQPDNTIPRDSSGTDMTPRSGLATLPLGRKIAHIFCRRFLMLPRPTHRPGTTQPIGPAAPRFSTPSVGLQSPLKVAILMVLVPDLPISPPKSSSLGCPIHYDAPGRASTRSLSGRVHTRHERPIQCPGFRRPLRSNFACFTLSE